MDRSRLFTFMPINRIFAAAALAGAIACTGTAGLTQTGAIMVAIDKMTVGAAPADFEFARTGQGGPAQWTVATDPTASGGRAFKAVAGKVDQAGGIVVRLADADNYYVLRANALEDNVRFYRVVKGQREQLEGANTKVTANEWHQLGLRAEGGRFTITFDGKQMFTAADQTVTSAGKVALWTKADSVTRFDRIEIKTLP